MKQHIRAKNKTIRNKRCLKPSENITWESTNLKKNKITQRKRSHVKQLGDESTLKIQYMFSF